MQELNRTFVGIRLPGETQQKLAEIQMTIRHKAGSDVVRFNNTAELQLVLIPLGELTVLSFDNVKKALPAVATQFQPFSITIEGLGGTPSNLQPRFVWAGIGGAVDDVIRLHNTLERSLMPMLPGYQAMPFKPHVDLGRMKVESEANRTALGRAIRMAQIGLIAELRVSQFELFRSTATTLGPHLQSEGVYPLGNA